MLVFTCFLFTCSHMCHSSVFVCVIQSRPSVAVSQCSLKSVSLRPCFIALCPCVSRYAMRPCVLLLVSLCLSMCPYLCVPPPICACSYNPQCPPQLALVCCPHCCTNYRDINTLFSFVISFLFAVAITLWKGVWLWQSRHGPITCCRMWYAPCLLVKLFLIWLKVYETFLHSICSQSLCSITLFKSKRFNICLYLLRALNSSSNW